MVGSEAKLLVGKDARFRITLSALFPTEGRRFWGKGQSKTSTIWVIHSKLQYMLRKNTGVNLKSFVKVHAFMKTICKNDVAKKDGNRQLWQQVTLKRVLAIRMFQTLLGVALMKL